MFALANAAHFTLLTLSTRCCGAANEVMRWINVYAVPGEDFPNAPDHAIYRQILGEKGVLPEQRLNNLSAELQRQQLIEKELMA